MSNRKTYLGLKASPKSRFEESPNDSDDNDDDDDDDDDIFDDDSQPMITLPHVQPSLSSQAFPSLHEPVSKLFRNENDNGIESLSASMKIIYFDDAYPKISSLLSAFDGSQYLSKQKNLIPHCNDIKMTKELKFVPEHMVPDGFSSALKIYANTLDKDITFQSLVNKDLSTVHKGIAAQIDIVAFSKGAIDGKCLIKYVKEENLDPQIMTLIYFVLSKNDDKRVSCFYSIQCLLEYIKCSEMAPISKLFPDFTTRNVFHSIALDLAELFPFNPLLPSVLHKFSNYDPEALDVLASIPEEDDNNDLMDSDFSDSFFESITACQKNSITPMIQLKEMFYESTINPLDNLQQNISNAVTVTVNEPPSMVTLKMNDGMTQLPPNLFADWITSLSPKKSQKLTKTVFLVPKEHNKQNAMLSSSSPDLASRLRMAAADKTEQPIATKESLINLISDEKEPQRLMNIMPSVAQDPVLYSLHLFLIQMINSQSNTIYLNGIMYPSIIKNEFTIHQALKSNDLQSITASIADLAKNIPELDIDITIKRIQEKRSIPKLEEPLNDHILTVMYLSDLELILNGRTPFTLNRIMTRDPMIEHPFPREQRAKMLFYYYTNFRFPPYISFRLAFSLAVNLSYGQQDMTSFASNLLFESIYGLIQEHPYMAGSECVRNSLLFFAEILERLDRYYYSALLLDVFFLGKPISSTSSAVAHFSHRRNDMARALFHFSMILKNFVDNNKPDEALYVSQVITSIYHDFGMPNHSIGLLTSLLFRTFNILIDKHYFEKPKLTRLKTLPIPSRKLPNGRTTIAEFEPSPQSTNALLNGIALVDLLIRTRYFHMAANLLNTINKSTDNRLYRCLIEFFVLKLKLRHNNFYMFLNKVPPIIMQTKRNSTGGSRLTMRAASTFDSNIAIVKLLTNAYITRGLFRQAIFWSEVIIGSQTRLAMKDLGNAYLMRGLSFMQARHQAHVRPEPLSLHVPLTPLMSQVCTYANKNSAYKEEDLVSEAVSSLKCARICYDRVGCTRKLILASLLYVEIIISYFLDRENPLVTAPPLSVDLPVLETKSTTIQTPMKIGFDSFIITNLNVEEELSVVCQSYETPINRMMNPIYIIFKQIVSARFCLVTKKVEQSKEIFNFAFSNLRRFFTCGGYLIYDYFPLTSCCQIQTLLEIMCLTLFHYDKDYINNRLLVFDWLSNVKNLVNDSLRCVPPENQTPIEPSVATSLAALHAVSCVQFPDFFATLEKSGVKLSETAPVDNSIGSIVFRINANVKLFENQKMKEDEMHENNHSLCQKLEAIAEKYRNDHSNLMPVDIDFSYLKQSHPNVLNTIILHAIYGKVYIYVPATGEKKIYPMKSNQNFDYFTYSRKPNEVRFPTTSESFPPILLEYISRLIINDKNSQKIGSVVIEKSVQKLRNTIFDGIGIDESNHQWEKVADSAFYGNQRSTNKGELYTIAKSPAPLIVVTDCFMSALPYEQIFKGQFVLRSWNFAQLILSNPQNKQPLSSRSLQPIISRRKDNFESSIERSISLVNFVISSFGGHYTDLQYVKKDERMWNFMLPCFSPNKDNSFYQEKYKFLKIVEKITDIHDTDKNDKTDKFDLNDHNCQSNANNNEGLHQLYLFSYADMVESPPWLRRLSMLDPFAFFMFVPAQLMKGALKLMKLVFERQKRRVEFVRETPQQPNDWAHIANVPYEFVAALQVTLATSLGCPVPLIAPN